MSGTDFIWKEIKMYLFRMISTDLYNHMGLYDTPRGRCSISN